MEVTVTLADTAGYLLSGESITLDPPAVGSLSPLSEITREDGSFKATFIVPNYFDVGGNKFIDIIARHTESDLIGSNRVDFLLPSLSVTSEPSAPSIPGDTAIIPGDSRFPARYQLILRDPEGRLLADIPLSISIEDSTIARLDGGGSSGREILVTTDDQGKALVEYTFLGSIPGGEAPLADTITVKNQDLGLEEYLYVSIGLDIQVITLSKAENGNQGNFPKTLGMRFQIQDAHRPEMNLFTYLINLERVTGNSVGMNLEIQWLNKPSPRFMDNLRSFFPNLANPPEPVMYKGDCVVSIGDNALSEIIIEALAQPSLSIGPNIFPAIRFPTPGNYWFRAVVTPVVLSKAGSNSDDYDLIRGMTEWETGPIFSAHILEESESLLQSLVCMFNPTSKQQFVVKSLFLDNPILTGLSVAGGIPFATMAATKVSGIICDYMKGNYFTAMANLISLDIAMRKNLVAEGIWDLTQAQQEQMARLHLLNFYWANWSAGKNSWDQFSAKSPKRNLSIETVLADSDEAIELWPEELAFGEYLDSIAQAMAGALASDDYFKDWDFIAVLGGDEDPVISGGGTNVISAGGNEVTVFFCPSERGELFVSSTGDLTVYHHHIESSDSVSVRSYDIVGTGEDTQCTLDLSSENILLVDRGRDGSIDTFLPPEINTYRDICNRSITKLGLTYPFETINDTTPTFTWNEDSCATWYKIYLKNKSSDYKFVQWYEIADNFSKYPEVTCTNGECSIVLDSTLDIGSYEWFVMGWNDNGNGDWSDGMTFTIQANDSPPSKVTHTSPSGQLASSTLTFTWVADPNATWYRLWVGYPGDQKIFAQWYEASDICSNGICSVTTGTEFNVGNYEWYIKFWNDSGKVWSDGMSFVVL